MNLQERLGELRREKNLPRPRVAELLGVTTQDVMDWESGVSAPTKEQCKLLAKLYNVALSELWQEEPCEEKKGKVILLWTLFGIWAAAMAAAIISFFVQNFG